MPACRESPTRSLILYLMRLSEEPQKSVTSLYDAVNEFGTRTAC